MDGNYSALIEEMTNMIIRPHRNTYLPDKLGNTPASQDRPTSSSKARYPTTTRNSPPINTWK